MKPPKILHYTVVGTGPFPIDMLRYDSCWPATPHAVELVAADEIVGTVHVDLAGLQCTPARWESFGWEVKK